MKHLLGLLPLLNDALSDEQIKEILKIYEEEVNKKANSGQPALYRAYQELAGAIDEAAAKSERVFLRASNNGSHGCEKCGHWRRRTEGDSLYSDGLCLLFDETTEEMDGIWCKSKTEQREDHPEKMREARYRAERIEKIKAACWCGDAETCINWKGNCADCPNHPRENDAKIGADGWSKADWLGAPVDCAKGLRYNNEPWPD